MDLQQQSVEVPEDKDYFNADDLAVIIGVSANTVRYHWRQLRRRGVLPGGGALSQVEAKRLLDYVAAIGRPKRRVTTGNALRKNSILHNN